MATFVSSLRDHDSVWHKAFLDHCRMDGWTGRWVGEGMGGWVDGWTDGRMGGWVGGARISLVYRLENLDHITST